MPEWWPNLCRYVLLRGKVNNPCPAEIWMKDIKTEDPPWIFLTVLVFLIFVGSIFLASYGSLVIGRQEGWQEGYQRCLEWSK